MLNLLGVANQSLQQRRGRTTLRGRYRANKRSATQTRSGGLGTVTIRIRPTHYAHERLRQVFSLPFAATLREGSWTMTPLTILST